ncbi:hypothetical protein ASC90_25585 [Rhizobium sp. Root1220]|nr:hypothetical protein ASC90_25585 [Rhizobium sp. Root1220]
MKPSKPLRGLNFVGILRHFVAARGTAGRNLVGPRKRPNWWPNMPVRDGGECISLFAPLLVSEGARSRPKLNDLALSLAEKSAAFSSSLPPAIASSLSELARTVNCYYSNLIEGRRTRPIDIERAVRFAPILLKNYWW